MAFGLPRIFVPALAFALGSWMGMGKPPPEEVVRVARPHVLRIYRVVKACVTECLEPTHASHSPAGPAVEEDPSPVTVDPDHLPEPTPWPRLNPECSITKAWLVAEGPARTFDAAHRLVTLTFDDGPFPETTPEVLKLLERYNTRAAFFFVGRYMDGKDVWAARTRATARRVAAAGHIIGNHTHDHSILSGIARAKAIAEIDDGARTIERVTGIRPVFFRPPYGQLDAWGERALARRGVELVLWNTEAGDMTSNDVDAMLEKLTFQLEFQGGGVVLLHDIRPTSVELLGKLLRWLDARRWDPYHPERKGYEVVDLVAYLRATAAKPQPYGSRAELEKARQEHWKATHGRPVEAAVLPMPTES